MSDRPPLRPSPARPRRNDVRIEEKERRILGPRPESERGDSFPLQ